MAMNLHTESIIDTTVDISPLLDVYIIDAVDATTYTYNLPSIVSDGQKFTLIRIDSTTGIVNLTGTMNINGTSISTFKIYPLSTVIVRSLNAIWYIVCSESTSPNNSNIVFNASFNNSISMPYTTFSSSIVMFYFAFLGRNNYSTISRIVITLASVAAGNTIVTLRSDTTLCTITITTGTFVAVYNLTAAEKNSLPATPDYLYLQRESGSTINVSSVIIYS